MRAYAVARTALLTLLFLVLVASAAIARPVDPPSPGQSQADVRVFYWVDQVFGSSYVANVMLTNMTPAPLEEWELTFDLNPPADNVRGGTLIRNGRTHTVIGSGRNRTIPVGGSVFFSIDGVLTLDSDSTTADVVAVPEACEFEGQRCMFELLEEPEINQQDTLGVDVGWWVASQGVSEYTAQILLRNTSGKRIDYWNLRFSSGSLITDIRHGDWVRTGSNYEVTGRGWTRSIEEDETIWLTLSGVHTGQVDTLQGCIFNGFPCTFADPEEFIDVPEEPETPDRLCSTLPNPSDDDNNQIYFDLKVTSLWPTGFVYAVDVINRSDKKPIRNWELRFTLHKDMNVTNVWNAEIRKSGEVYTVTPLPETTCIEPGESVRFGMEGTHKGSPVAPCRLIPGSACSLLTRSATTTAIEDEDSGLTRPGSAFELEAPYPNPFSVEAKVPFRVSETQRVTVTLWDMQGRQVGKLFDATAAAGQAYQISVPAGALPSGVYMVRLTGATGSGVTTPLMLVR